MNNTQRVTLASFIAYFVMSGMLAPIGILSAPMAETFNETVSGVTARFSWLTMGVLVGAIIALFAFDVLRLRWLMVGIYSAITACLLALTSVDTLALAGWMLGIVGVCCGIGLPGAALLISRLYADEMRASMLVITDGAFSVSGIVCSWLAVTLVAQQFHWSGTYLFVGLMAALIVVLILLADLPEARANEADELTTQWSPGVWLCLVALFLYTFGQWCFLLWLPNYAEVTLGAPRAEAGQIVGQFWSGMFAAQLFVAWWVVRVGVPRLVVIAGLSTVLFSLPLWLHDSIEGLIWLALLFGFANLGLLKIILSYATQMVTAPSPRLISSLLLGATIGTAVSPWITSQLVELTSNHRILQVGTLSYVCMLVLLVVASRYYVPIHSQAPATEPHADPRDRLS